METPEILITKVENGCIEFLIDGTISNGLNVMYSVNSGFTWTSLTGSVASPRCGLPITTVTTWYQIQSLDNLSNYSNLFIVEPADLPIVPSEILLVNSPFYINFDEIPFFDGILNVRLYIWSGAYAEIPINPSHTFTVNGSYLEVGQYIKDFLNPQPNSTYFTSIQPDGFNECCNVYYEFDVLNKIDNEYFEWGMVKSTLKFATLGYGLYAEGANPVLSLHAIDELVTIDSTLVTIDSIEHTLDNGGYRNPDNDAYRNLFNHSRLFHKNSERIFNGLLNEKTIGSNDLILRQLTNDFISTCGGKYKGRHVMYLNSNGFLDTFSFPFAENRRLKIKNDSYIRLISNPHKYNIYQASKVHLNKEITIEWTMNTGILDIYNVGIIEEIVNSDRHWLIDYENQAFIPLNITTTTFDEKSRENDRGKIQYTLVFQQGDYKNEMR
ncbi:hypothetical protein NJT12_04945 [Flavobacterium sp. AC]|uniref:Uncharacterized protein n=1 Tax=Flavobacterium azizsancarii TaxID=2961580 RepID=A0ABT4WA28_9FLAO|nr:hypothetical protein [Flavobacterium azizsancarii]MDA6068964.1 hypothetical protein [Flavobacterium azizsancarii]